jgi:hypothetical protein
MSDIPTSIYNDIYNNLANITNVNADRVINRSNVDRLNNEGDVNHIIDENNIDYIVNGNNVSVILRACTCVYKWSKPPLRGNFLVGGWRHGNLPGAKC